MSTKCQFFYGGIPSKLENNLTLLLLWLVVALLRDANQARIMLLPFKDCFKSDSTDNDGLVSP